MTTKEFEKCVSDAFNTLPEKYRKKVNNVAFIVEQEPSFEVRTKEGLSEEETLLGLYTGIPLTLRGEGYGIGLTLPDTIHIYQGPIEEEAEGDPVRIQQIVFDTVWHEVAHYFGLDEDAVMRREAEGTNKPKER
jgi:predicted Zn-dependent protease with MMP-like domain